MQKRKRKKENEVAQSCLALCNSMDCSLPDSTVHVILQARILEWVAITFSSGSSWPRDWTWVSRTAGRLSTIWATREAIRYTQLNAEFQRLARRDKKALLCEQWKEIEENNQMTPL